MEIRFKGSLEALALKNLGSIFRRVATIHLENSSSNIPVDMFTASCLPHEAARTYRAMVAEFECKRSRALVEVQRQTFCV